MIRYEITVTSPDADIGYYPIIHRKEEPVHHPYHASGYSRKTLFGYPFILSVPDASKVTYKQVRKIPSKFILSAL
jgi:hypothetical protein